MKLKAKSYFILFLKVLTAVGLMLWLVQSGSFEVKELLQVLTPLRVFSLLSLCFMLITLNSYRWKRILLALGRDIPFRKVLPLSFIAVFFNLVMPGGVGGDVIKGYYFTKQYPGSRADSIFSIFIDRFIGLYVLILMAAVALILRWDHFTAHPVLRSLGVGTFGFLFVFTLIFAFSFSKKLQALPGVSTLFESFPHLKHLHRFQHLTSTLTEAFLICALSQTSQVYFIVCIGHWLDVPLNLPDYFYIVPLGILATSLPLTPAGIGVGQAAFYFLVNLALGYESSLGPLAISAFQLAQVFWSIPGIGFYLFRKTYKV